MVLTSDVLAHDRSSHQSAGSEERRRVTADDASGDSPHEYVVLSTPDLQRVEIMLPISIANKSRVAHQDNLAFDGPFPNKLVSAGCLSQWHSRDNGLYFPLGQEVK